jgi:hypothetical protein
MSAEIVRRVVQMLACSLKRGDRLVDFGMRLRRGRSGRPGLRLGRRWGGGRRCRERECEDECKYREHSKKPLLHLKSILVDFPLCGMRRSNIDRGRAHAWGAAASLYPAHRAGPQHAEATESYCAASCSARVSIVRVLRWSIPSGGVVVDADAVGCAPLDSNGLRARDHVHGPRRRLRLRARRSNFGQLP